MYEFLFPCCYPVFIGDTCYAIRVTIRWKTFIVAEYRDLAIGDKGKRILWKVFSHWAISFWHVRNL
jgi:hypothetical protein